MQHDSGVEYHSQSEHLIHEDPLIRARRARRGNRNPSATTNSGDESRREGCSFFFYFFEEKITIKYDISSRIF